MGLLMVPGCKFLDQQSADPANDVCAARTLTSVSGSTGQAQVFYPDPVGASGNAALSPFSFELDKYRMPVELEHLGGKGVLEGRYVDVRNGISCDDWFSAYDTKNNFSYSHQDPRFQEAMAYYLGDRYRADLDALGYLKPASPVQIIAHCQKMDNAFFARQRDASGGLLSIVCLGDSVAAPGAYYGDDGAVTLHELQHATTTDLYTGADAGQSLNQFWYDEAGALNEGVSDFMALVYTAPALPMGFDPRGFSRWALDKFFPGQRAVRGAYRCPEYDSAFGSGCGGFPAFSSDRNTVSYVYPDGLGWPQANNFSGPDYVRAAFKSYRSQEEIHNAGIVLEGALWDMYEALKTGHDAATAQTLSMKAVLGALPLLPHPAVGGNLSPVTFRGFAAAMAGIMSRVGFTASDQDRATQALTARGLLGGTLLPAGWLQIGAGSAAAPGLYVEDNPAKLKSWLLSIGSDPSQVTQGIETGLNNRLDPGEVAAVWFDLANNSAVSAGAVHITVTSQDPEVTFLDNRTNVAPVSAQAAQIQYFKINGTSVSAALSGAQYPLSTGNSYFLTNPYYAKNSATALWLKVSATAAHGKTVHLLVEAEPSNGAKSTVTVPVTIH